jgi:hypothetical protein
VKIVDQKKMYIPSKNEFLNYKKQQMLHLAQPRPSLTIGTPTRQPPPSSFRLTSIPAELDNMIDMNDITVNTIDMGPISERLTGNPEIQQRQMFSDKVKSFYYYMSITITMVWVVAIMIIFMLRFYKR